MDITYTYLKWFKEFIPWKKKVVGNNNHVPIQKSGKYELNSVSKLTQKMLEPSEIY